MAQHLPPLTASPETLLRRLAWVAPEAPSRINMLARVAASNTSSTPSILSAEHSLYARAPIDWATRSACAREIYRSILASFLGGRKSAFHPTRIMRLIIPPSHH